MKQMLMARGAAAVVKTCLGVKKGEQILIVTEPEKQSLAEAVARAVYGEYADPAVMVMLPRDRDGQEPPKMVAAAMKESDGFICIVGRSITHTHAVKNACQAGSRGIMLTQFSEAMMIHGGLEADFPQAARDCRAVAKRLGGAKKIRLTTAAGTDLTFSAAGRRSNAMCCMVEPGEFAPVPTVEANVSPLEGTANGILIADASIPYIGIGLLQEPVVCQVKGGRIVSIEGGSQAKRLAEDLEAKNDENVYNIAEMGVGLNPRCSFMGFMLEDEGVYGSVHIGIGTSLTLGGTVKAACHYDLIMHRGTIEADGEIIMREGVLQL